MTVGELIEELKGYWEGTEVNVRDLAGDFGSVGQLYLNEEWDGEVTLRVTG